MLVARVLVLDIETSPAIVYTFGMFKQNISINQIIEPTRMLSVAARWVGEKNVMLFTEWDLPERTREHNRQNMVEAIHALLDEADVIVSYNGKTFDVPHLNREFVSIGLLPPSPYAHVDLYQVVKSKFRFLSGKLEWVVKTLDLGGKMAHEGFALWSSVLDGDPGAQKRMGKYNKQDVVITESLYMALLPWITNHPHMGLIEGMPDGCPRCSSMDLQKRGVARTSLTEYQRYQCKTCGAWSRSGKKLDASASLRNIV